MIYEEKPQTVEAIQFIGSENEKPIFNTTKFPEWLTNKVKGKEVFWFGGNLFIYEESELLGIVQPGGWLLYTDDGLKLMTDERFNKRYQKIT
jgi:hypothetical protein